MTDHPSTFKGTPVESGSTAWTDHASLIPVETKDGLFTRLTAVRTGTFAGMIRHLAALREDQRADYVIEKAGDREYSPDEAMRLASRDDFPSKPGSEHDT
ncbi:MAG: hypothetical protein AAF291_04705 [Pseudomonadota bacterium]